MAKNKVNVSEPQHARIDRHTRRIKLSVPNTGLGAIFSIAGTWRDLAADGPDATTVVVNCHVADAVRRSSHTLTEDTTFKLPYGTVQLDITVSDSADCAAPVVRAKACSQETPPKLTKPVAHHGLRPRTERRALPLNVSDVSAPNAAAAR